MSAVDIYALISGYVGYSGKWKPQNLIRLWMQAVFYCLLLETVFMLFDGSGSLSYKRLLLAVIPVTTGTYWYLTSYVAVFLFIPFMNWGINNLSKGMATQIVLAGTVLGCWDLISAIDIFRLNKKYSAAWLIFLYFTGAYIRKYYSGAKYKVLFRRFCGFGFVIITCAVYISVVILQKVSLNASGDVKKIPLLTSYTSLPILMAAISLLLFFSAIEIKEYSLITFFTPTTFGVYLIHNHPLIARQIMPRLFGEYINCSIPVTIIVYVAGTITIFTVAALIDRIRGYLFSKLMLNELCKKGANVFSSVIHKLISILTD